MPVTVACDDCGRTYVLPDASRGKRAHCLGCKRLFVVPSAAVDGKPPLRLRAPPMPGSAPRGGSATPPSRVVEQYRLRNEVEEDDLARLAEVAEAEGPAIHRPTPRPTLQPGWPATTHPMLGLLGTCGRWLGRIRTEDRILLGLAMLAAATFGAALAIPDVAPIAFAGFVLLAVVYLIVGFFIVTARSARSGTSVRITWNWQSVLLTLGLGLVGYLIFRRVFLVRRRGDGQGDMSGLMALLVHILKSGLVAGFGIAIFAYVDLSGRRQQHGSYRPRTALEKRVATLPLATGGWSATPSPVMSLPIQSPARLSRASRSNGGYRSPIDVPSAPKLTFRAPQPAGPNGVFIAPFSSPEEAETARQSLLNVRRIVEAVVAYWQYHGQVWPKSLDVLDGSFPPDRDPRVSPFDPARGTKGYAYVPGNMSAFTTNGLVNTADHRVAVYDAAELERTGHTHAAGGPNMDVRVLTRAELADAGVPTLPPPVVTPVAVPDDANASTDPAPTDLAAETAANMRRIAAAISRYRYRHGQQSPRTLDDLTWFLGGDSRPRSPFGEGYVLFPDHLSADGADDRPAFYDAGELRQTGSTHVILGRSLAVRLMTGDELRSSSAPVR
jgi:hypothetical protein